MDRLVYWKLALGCTIAVVGTFAVEKEAQAHFLAGHAGHGASFECGAASSGGCECGAGCSDASGKVLVRGGGGGFGYRPDNKSYYDRSNSHYKPKIKRMGQISVRNRNGGIN